MLITVTGFLRDRKSFDTLREAFAPIVRAKSPGDTVRAWVVGCATGEEAYSVAMMLADMVRERGNDLGIKVFATDISDVAMDVARRGIYHRSALKDIPPEWSEQYFSIQGESIQVHKHLREMLVIARQDVTVDPPLVRMDLVTCRNLLIYLVPDVQARVLRSFQVALNPKGLLFLGRSENVPAETDMFTTVNAPSKIYLKTTTSANPAIGYVAPPRSLALSPRLPLRTNRNALADDLRDRMLSEYAPPSVLVDASGTPVHQVGDLSRYISLPKSGDYRLSEMIVPSLRTEVSSMLEKAQRDSIAEISHTLIVRFPDDSMESVCVKVIRFARPAARRSRAEDNEVFALVSFIPQTADMLPATTATRPALQPDTGEHSDDLIEHVAELERELIGTRQHLQSVVEELESSNEELQAMNEELQASSEELQATNEELETTNEELQATNEELTTVNETLEVRTAELSETSVVLQNIQDAVHTAIVLVDNYQRVQQFSPLAVKVFGLVNSDLGTPLGSLPTTIDVDGLTDRVQNVLDTGQGFITEVSSTTATYLMQIVAYRAETTIRGAVIALSDVTELARARNALAGISEEFRALTEGAPVAIYRTGPDLITPIEISPSIQDILDLPDFNPATDPQRITHQIHPDDTARVMELRVRNREHDYQTDYRLTTPTGQTRTIREISRVLTDEHNRPTRRVGLLFRIADRQP